MLVGVMRLPCIPLTLCLLSLYGRLLAQSEERRVRIAEAGLGVGDYQGALAFSWAHHWKIGARQRFHIGLGARFTSFVAQNKYYITAPAQLTSGDTGPQVIFQENIPENIDSLLLNSPWVNSINATVHLTWSFSDRVQAGFNIDLVGASFGSRESGNYINGATGQFVDASPTVFNLLLVSDNDRGSLNSELWARCFVSDRWALKGGAMFLFTEYTTESEVQQYPEPNDRFRLKSLMATLGVSYRLSE
jgi:hypothetical protein